MFKGGKDLEPWLIVYVSALQDHQIAAAANLCDLLCVSARRDMQRFFADQCCVLFFRSKRGRGKGSHTCDSEQE